MFQRLRTKFALENSYQSWKREQFGEVRIRLTASLQEGAGNSDPFLRAESNKELDVGSWGGRHRHRVTERGNHVQGKEKCASQARVMKSDFYDYLLIE